MNFFRSASLALSRSFSLSEDYSTKIDVLPKAANICNISIFIG